MSMNNWSRYFEEVSEFLQGAERQYGIANDAYTDYALERLEICILFFFFFVYNNLANGKDT